MSGHKWRSVCDLSEASEASEASPGQGLPCLAWVVGHHIVAAHVGHEAVDDVDGHRKYDCGVVLRRDAVESLEISELEIINNLDFYWRLRNKQVKPCPFLNKRKKNTT